jgi:hypothetical protein
MLVVNGPTLELRARQAIIATGAYTSGLRLPVRTPSLAADTWRCCWRGWMHVTLPIFKSCRLSSTNLGTPLGTRTSCQLSAIPTHTGI